MGAPDERLLVKALECARRLQPTGDESLNVLVATDDFDFKEMAMNKSWWEHSGGKSTERIDTARGDDGKPFKPKHSDRQFLDSLGIENAWLDQFALSQAAGLVKTSGGFAYWASEIGLIPTDRVLLFGVDGEETSCEMQT